MKKKVLTVLAALMLCIFAAGETSACQHAWENCICTLCGELCLHPGFDDGRCTACGVVCQHYNWRGDRCAFCGVACPHSEWEDGRCTLCHTLCDHAHHDPDTLICSVCGAVAQHSYEEGVCTGCGAALVGEAREVPREMFYTCPAHGMLATLYYNPTDYVNGGPLSKKMNVYLPSGYSAGKKYDVLVLMHGMYDSESYWLNQDLIYRGDYDATVTTKALLDNMIAQGLCREMIVVCPTFYPVSGNYNNFNREREQTQLRCELRWDILPLIASTYSTYAEGWTEDELRAARDHFAYAGLSLGSIYAYNTVLPDDMDIISWFGCFSGSEADVYEVAAKVDAFNPDLYPIHYFYNSVGTNDSMGYQHNSEYQTLMKECKALAEGKNACFQYINYANHEYRAWVTGLYNFLPMLFT